MKAFWKGTLVLLLFCFLLEPVACDRWPTRPEKRQDETAEEESRYAVPEQPPAVQPFPNGGR